MGLKIILYRARQRRAASSSNRCHPHSQRSKPSKTTVRKMT